MRLFLTLLLALGLSFPALIAQNAPDFWSQISPEEVVLTGAAEQKFEPLKYKVYSLDYQPLAAYLTGAPREFTAAARTKSFQITLPMANGKKEVFAIVKTRVMHPDLEALHPEIGTYAGEAVNTPGMHLRITVTPGWGFRAMITRADKGVEYLEPVADWQNQYYMAYDRVDLAPDPIAAQIPTCKEIHQDNTNSQLEKALKRFSPEEDGPGEGEKLLGGPVSLKIYRFACAATGEFSQDNGGTKDLVFQKITTTTNLLNGILERDINIRLQLIPESYNVIFLDPATDPYLNNTVDGWMNQNPGVMDQFLGPASLYDIGHVFARYIAGDAIGIASLGSCCTANKARGCSAGPGTYGDYFLGIAAHELGHQWSANHTFNQCNLGDQFSMDSACEPGGGNTILGYNSCGNNNTTGGRDLYYHACSMAEIKQFVELGAGATCGTIQSTNNNAPMVSTNYPAETFIPISTPFELTGTGTDPDGNPLVFTWDEIDRGPTSPLGTPSGNSPLFFWVMPTASPTRTFPMMQRIINNVNAKTEVLPTYSRDVTFAFVARDNQLNGGGVASTTVKLKSTSTAGPFLVNYPNDANATWKVGEYQTVLWDVANTDKNPVKCQTVNIKLSTNGGQTYPITLATNVPNIGKACIVVPNNLGATMRVRVEAADNVFFDISNANFTIAAASPGISLCASTLKDFACLPGAYTLQISTIAIAGASDPIMLSATGLPNGATATFSPNPVQPGNSSTMTITFPNNSPENTFDVTVQGSANALSASTAVTFTVVNNDFSAFGPTSPANGAAGVNTNPILTWSTVPDADFYVVQLATNPSFESSVLVVSSPSLTVGSYQVSTMLEEGKVYYWRVRPINDCDNAPWSDVQVFVVAVQSCGVFVAADLPKTISANSVNTVESKITLATGGAISDLNIKKIQGTHAFFKDLDARLVGPTGTEVLLWTGKCGAANGAFNILVDDGATAGFPCPPNNISIRPDSPLSVFNGQSSAGVWTLRVKDNVISSGGSLTAFELEICSSNALNPPQIVINAPLMVASGANAVIGDNLLKAEDANNGPTQLQFTLMSLPAHGQLQVNGVPATVGMQFTQQDISNGSLRYYDYGQNLGSDLFHFSVTDGEGGLAKGTYSMEPFLVGTHEPTDLLSFDLAPNPASSTAVLSLSQPLTSDARVTLLNIAGQVVSTWQLAAGSYSLRLGLQDLPKGVYVVSLETDKVKSVKKLVIQ